MNIDEVKKFWDARPCNIRHSDKEVGSRDYFSEVTLRKYLVEPHIIPFADFFHWKGKRVLEIGCGIGTDTMMFAWHGAQVTAVDLSEMSLSIARKRAELYGLSDRITFHQANAEELSQYVPVETYDLVYSFGVLHHTPNPEAAFQEIRKFMGPDSEFRFMVYHKKSWKVLWILLKYWKEIFKGADALIAKYSEAQIGCPVTYAYTKKDIAESLRGYRVKNISIDHIFPYHIPAYVKYQYQKVWYFAWMPKFLFRLLEKNFGWHLCVTARLA